MTKAAKITNQLVSKVDASYVMFAQRTIAAYKEQQKSGPLHMNYRKVFKSCVTRVMQQVRPKSARPCRGNKVAATAELLPVLRKFFNIKQKLKEGTPAFVQQLLDQDVWTLQDCVKYEDVMTHHLKLRK